MGVEDGRGRVANKGGEREGVREWVGRGWGAGEH